MKIRKCHKGAARLLICCILFGLIGPRGAVEAAKKKKGVVTADSLNVRVDAGANFDRLQVDGVNAFLRKGETVTIQKEKDGWYYVSFTFGGKSVKGYVIDDYIKVQTSEEEEPTPKPTATPVPTPTPAVSENSGVIYTKKLETTKILYDLPAYVNTSVLNLRSIASTSGDVVEKMTKDTLIRVANELMTKNGKWYKIVSEETGNAGYVHSDYIILDYDYKLKATIYSSKKVYLRKTASDIGKYVVDKKKTKINMKKGKAITLLNEVSVDGVKWFYISVKVDKTTYKGYVKADVVRMKQTISEQPTKEPTPTPKPTKKPTATPEPTAKPTKKPTATPTAKPTKKPTPTPTPTPEPYKAVGGRLNYYYACTIYTEPSYMASLYQDAEGNLLYTYNTEPIAIYEQLTNSEADWYYVGVKYQNSYLYGYIPCAYMVLSPSDDEVVSKWEKPVKGNQPGEVPTVTPSPSGGVELTPTPTQEPTITPTQVPESNESFEEKLTREGFPDSYKELLRELHKTYPYWEFEAYHTGLTWDEVMVGESPVSLNLITNSKGVEWKSLDPKAYNWKTDKFIPYDGSTWVAASQAARAYYIDPRNFLTSNGIFQFELLSYRSAYQDEAGVENVLRNTPMSHQSFSFTDDDGVVQTMTYAQAIVDAAKYSNVSPYHLASRIKQEILKSSKELSNSVSGTVAGYEGLYNFYNIGANDSTKPGGAIINGLNYALNGVGNANIDKLSKIPWDNPYKAIVGGAYIIGRNYINRGNGVNHNQDTVYLQKFNVTDKTRYRHQYMTNVEAPYAEAKKMSVAYENLANVPIVFSIPVYIDMPAKPASYPAKQYNPNNWLKQITVTDDLSEALIMTPTFTVSEETEYSIIVGEETEYVMVDAKTVSTKAKIVSGTGVFVLEPGTNVCEIEVCAENGDVRTYQLYIVKP